MMLICKDCGAEVTRRGQMQKYCEACSLKRDLERKRIWARSHPPTVEQKKRNALAGRRQKEWSRDAGSIENSKHRLGLDSYAVRIPELLWCVRVAVPFTYAASKNHIYALCVNGHVALRRESRAKRAEIAIALRTALAGRRVAHGKLWIDILVQKPNHRGDAVNVVDLVCDAIKDAVPVDDRWFCLRFLDWQIVKEQPQLIVGIGQESDRDYQVCSYCGQIKELKSFNRNKDQPLGVGRECRECRHQGRLLRHELPGNASRSEDGATAA